MYNDNKSCKKLNIHSVSVGIWSADIKDVLQKVLTYSLKTV